MVKVCPICLKWANQSGNGYHLIIRHKKMGPSNIGEAGSRLEIRRRGEYKKFCNLPQVEAESENWKMEVELLDLESSIESFVISFYDRAQFRVYYLFLKGIRVLSVGLRARTVGQVKPSLGLIC